MKHKTDALTFIGRSRTIDHFLTHDSALNGAYDRLNERGDMRGESYGQQYRTHDGVRTVDSSGAFLVGELERLDQTMHMPLSAVTWSRDIMLREDVSIADEQSSFTLTTFGAQGNLGAGNSIRNGKNWVQKSTDQIGGVSLDLGKWPQPLTPWAMELKYTILELASAAKVGRPIDAQKLEALRLKHQMDTDEQVYVGDATLNVNGLFNATIVSNVANVPNGAAGTSKWSTKTPQEMLNDVNEVLTSAWAASGWSTMPSKIILPPAQFGYISTANIAANTTQGSISILRYLLENNIRKSSGNGMLEIVPSKWLVGAGVGGTLGTTGTVDRMMVYTNEKRFCRFPMVPMQRTPVQFNSIYHMTTYYCRLGVVEIVYPETFAYRDGI